MVGLRSEIQVMCLFVVLRGQQFDSNMGRGCLADFLNKYSSSYLSENG